MDRFRNEGSVMVGSEYIDLEVFLGCKCNTIEVRFRERDEAWVHVNSYNAYIQDLACDPRYGGIGGCENIAQFYGVSEQQFRRNILPGLTYIRIYAGRPVTNVSSAWADGASYQLAMHEKRCGNLGIEL